MIRLGLVLDANILIRAVLGRKVRGLLEQFQASAAFFAPDAAFADAEKYLPPIFDARGLDWTVGAAVLARIPALVQPVAADMYRAFEREARSRLRDERDWPVLATALALNCPAWTEDADFFGSGIATWTSATVPLYLKAGDPSTS